MELDITMLSKASQAQERIIFSQEQIMDLKKSIGIGEGLCGEKEILVEVERERVMRVFQ